MCVHEPWYALAQSWQFVQSTKPCNCAVSLNKMNTHIPASFTRNMHCTTFSPRSNALAIQPRSRAWRQHKGNQQCKKQPTRALILKPISGDRRFTCSLSASLAEEAASSSSVMFMLCMSGKTMDPRLVSRMCSQPHLSAGSPVPANSTLHF